MTSEGNDLVAASPPNLVANYRRKLREREAEKRRKRNAEVDSLIENMADPKVAEKLRIYRLVETQFQEIEAQVERDVAKQRLEAVQAAAAVRKAESARPPPPESEAGAIHGMTANSLREANQLFQRIDRMKREMKLQQVAAPFEIGQRVFPSKRPQNVQAGTSSGKTGVVRNFKSLSKTAGSKVKDQTTKRPEVKGNQRKPLTGSHLSNNYAKADTNDKINAFQRPGAKLTPLKAESFTTDHKWRTSAADWSKRPSFEQRMSSVEEDGIIVHGPPIKVRSDLTDVATARNFDANNQEVAARNVLLSTYVYHEPSTAAASNSANARGSTKSIMLTGHLLEGVDIPPDISRHPLVSVQNIVTGCDADGGPHLLPKVERKPEEANYDDDAFEEEEEEKSGGSGGDDETEADRLGPRDAGDVSEQGLHLDRSTRQSSSSVNGEALNPLHFVHKIRGPPCDTSVRSDDYSSPRRHQPSLSRPLDEVQIGERPAGAISTTTTAKPRVVERFSWDKLKQSLSELDKSLSGESQRTSNNDDQQGGEDNSLRSDVAKSSIDVRTSAGGDQSSPKSDASDRTQLQPISPPISPKEIGSIESHNSVQSQLQEPIDNTKEQSDSSVHIESRDPNCVQAIDTQSRDCDNVSTQAESQVDVDLDTLQGVPILPADSIAQLVEEEAFAGRQLPEEVARIFSHLSSESSTETSDSAAASADSRLSTIPENSGEEMPTTSVAAVSTSGATPTHNSGDFHSIVEKEGTQASVSSAVSSPNLSIRQLDAEPPVTQPVKQPVEPAFPQLVKPFVDCEDVSDATLGEPKPAVVPLPLEKLAAVQLELSEGPLSPSSSDLTLEEEEDIRSRVKADHDDDDEDGLEVRESATDQMSFHGSVERRASASRRESSSSSSCSETPYHSVSSSSDATNTKSPKAHLSEGQVLAMEVIGGVSEGELTFSSVATSNQSSCTTDQKILPISRPAANDAAGSSTSNSGSNEVSSNSSTSQPKDAVGVNSDGEISVEKSKVIFRKHCDS